MKKRTSSMSRRIVSLLMSMVLTLTLVTPAAFATEVVGGSGTAIIEGNTNPADPAPARTARTMRTRTPRTARTNSPPNPVMRVRTPMRIMATMPASLMGIARTKKTPMGIRRTRKTRTSSPPRTRITAMTRSLC